MDERLATALRPSEPSWVIRRGSVLPGLKQTRDQIERYGRYWRHEAELALGSRRPALVCLGDSLAQSIGASAPEQGYVGRLRDHLETRVGPVSVLNLSRSGARIEDVVHTQLPALDNAQVEVAWVTCTVGSNDLVRSARWDRIRKSLSVLLEELPPQAVMATVPANGSVAAKSLNRHLRREAARFEVEVADVERALTTWRGRRASDLFHPNDDGYQLWADVMTPCLTGPTT